LSGASRMIRSATRGSMLERREALVLPSEYESRRRGFPGSCCAVARGPFRQCCSWLVEKAMLQFRSSTIGTALDLDGVPLGHAPLQARSWGISSKVSSPSALAHRASRWDTEAASVTTATPELGQGSAVCSFWSGEDMSGSTCTCRGQKRAAGRLRWGVGVVSGAWGKMSHAGDWFRLVKPKENKTRPSRAMAPRFEPFASPFPHPYDQEVLRLGPGGSGAPDWTRLLRQ